MIWKIFSRNEYLVPVSMLRDMRLVSIPFRIDGVRLKTTLKIEIEHEFRDKFVVWKIFGVAVRSRIVRNYLVETTVQGNFLFYGAEHVFPILDEQFSLNEFLAPDPVAIPYKRFVLRQNRFVVKTRKFIAELVGDVWKYLEVVERELVNQITAVAAEYIRSSAVEQGFENVEV